MPLLSCLPAKMDISMTYIINHVILPPKLPQSDDSEVSNDSALLDTLQDGLERFQEHMPEQDRLPWVPLTGMVRNMHSLRTASRRLAIDSTEQALKQMASKGMQSALTK